MDDKRCSALHALSQLIDSTLHECLNHYGLQTGLREEILEFEKARIIGKTFDDGWILGTLQQCQIHLNFLETALQHDPEYQQWLKQWHIQ